MAGPAASSTRGETSTALPQPLPQPLSQPLLEHLRRTAERPTEGTALVARAQRVARELLDPAGSRWRHTAGVAARALQARAAVPLGQDEVLVAAAWLHDVGYAPAIVRTGFHSLDGALHLRETGWPESVVGLVAHHSGARFVAEVNGFAEELAVFDDPRGWEGPLADALVWADQTTGPEGHLVCVHARLAEARDRHGEGSDLARAHERRAPAVLAAAAATERRLAGATPWQGVPAQGGPRQVAALDPAAFDVRG